MAPKFPLAVIISAVDKLSGPLAKMAGNVGKFGSKATAIGKTMSLAVTAPIVGAGAAALVGFAKYEKSMIRLKAVTKASAGEMEMLERQASDLGVSSTFGVGAIAELQHQLAREGKNAQEVLAATPKLADLATIAGVELGAALSGTQQVMESFGMSSEQTGTATQFLAAMTTKGGVGFDELQKSMVQIGPLAGQMGVSLEQTMGALAALDDAGVKGKKGGAALSAMLNGLRDPSEQGEEALAALGISFGDVFDEQGKVRDFAGVFDLLKEKGANQAQLAALFGNEWDSVNRIMQNGGDSIRRVASELQVLDTAAAAGEMRKGLAAAWNRFTASIEKFGNAIAKSGIAAWAEALLEKGTALLNWLSELDPAWLKTISVIGGVVAAIGPLLVFIGTLSTGWGMLSTAIGVVMPVLSGLAAFIFTTAIPAIASMTIALLTFPGTWIVAAIAAVVAGVIWLWKNWDKVVQWFADAWDWLVDKVKWWADMHVQMIRMLVDKAKALLPDWLLDLFGSDGETKVITQETAAAAAGARMSIHETKESRVTVEFDGLPDGARLRAERGADVDLSLGYAMVAPG